MAEPSSLAPQRPRVITSPSYLAVPDPARSLSSSPSSSPEISPFIPSSLAAHSFAAKPSVSRVNSHTRSISQSLAMPSPTPASTGGTTQSRRLLMPTVRPTKQMVTYSPSPKIPSSSKSSPSKLGRSRAGSLAPPSVQNTPDLTVLSSSSTDWIGGGSRFEVMEDQIELEGYQIYAVEKWVVERRRPVTTLTVYTGNPKHKVTVTALSPLSTLSPAEQRAEWDKAMHHLRRDGAKPRETEKGIVMITSLANFRSDFTIVHIPRGNFLEVQEQLYTNIDVLRMGCSGRSALTLEEPSDTTKDRFISMYYIPEKTLTRAQELFNPTVLELVKLTQAALAICGMFDLAPEERNGLLCDVTCDGIQRWIAEIGEPCMEVEPTERIADPSVVAALFSMILTIRNKLHALGHAVPKDPFIDPCGFIKALTAFQSSSKPHGNGHGHNLSISHHLPLGQQNHPSSSTLPSSANTPSGSTSNIQSPSSSLTYLDRHLIQAIQAAYDKFKHSESYKVHKVLINKLDDLATDLRTNPEAHGRGGVRGGLWSNAFTNPTSDLDAFVRVVVLGGSSKESASSLRYLWSGRPEEVARKRREREVLNDNEEREGEFKAEKEGKDKAYEKEKAEDDEVNVAGGKPWSGRVQKRIEAWASLNRSKKLSTDLGNKIKPWITAEGPSRGSPPLQTAVPAVVISRDGAEEEEILSSGQTSPVSDSHGRHPATSLGTFPAATRSATEFSDYDRRISEFNHKRPPMKPQYQSRITSWADPVTARDIIDEPSTGKKRALSPLSRTTNDGLEDASTLVDAEEPFADIRRAKLLYLRGRRSFDDAERLRGTRVLPIERMRIDVELCGQLLIMHRREQHLANVLACLETLTHTLSASNATLRHDYEEHRPAFEELKSRAAILQQIEALRAKADALTQETNALAYESAQFSVDDLYHMASQPRLKVLEMREKVFGTGRRLRQGVHGAHGQFNRVQWTIDGKERLVDMWGRTESENEEEATLPGARVVVPEEEEQEIVEHPTLRPTWVLNFFNYFGSRWGKDRHKQQKRDAKSPAGVTSPGSATGSGSEPSPPAQMDRNPSQASSSSVEVAPVDGRTAYSRNYTG